QTALRDAIGKHDLAELIQSRKELGHGLQEALDRKMHDWGIQVQSVEIRDVVIPQALEEAMSRQAQAERERQARIILGTAETEIASKFVEAAERYSESPVALNLRAMNMLYESIVKRGSLMVVPSGLADSLNLPGIMGMAGAAGLGAEGAPEVAAGGGGGSFLRALRGPSPRSQGDAECWLAQSRGERGGCGGAEGWFGVCGAAGTSRRIQGSCGVVVCAGRVRVRGVEPASPGRLSGGMSGDPTGRNHVHS